MEENGQVSEQVEEPKEPETPNATPTGGQEEGPPQWFVSWQEQNKREAEASKKSDLPPPTTIPGTSIAVPSNWDEMADYEREGFTANARLLEQQKQEQLKLVAPIAKTQKYQELSKGMSEEESKQLSAIMDNLDPSAVLAMNGEQATAIRAMARGLAMENAPPPKDGDSPKQPVGPDYSAMRQDYEKRFGKAVSDATTDDELKEIYAS